MVAGDEKRTKNECTSLVHSGDPPGGWIPPCSPVCITREVRMPADTTDTPADILKARFAKGEIHLEYYKKAKDALMKESPCPALLKK